MINRESNKRKKNGPPFTIAQASPLGRQEIRDHEGLPVTFRFGGRAAVLMAPGSRPFVVLKEHRLVVCDKNKGTRKGATERIRIVVQKWESRFVICPSMNERVSIGHDVVSLMPINIHPVFFFAVAILQLCKISLCCLPGNAGLVNPQPSN